MGIVLCCGCELVAKFDRAKIPPPSSDRVDSVSDASVAGAGGDGVSGGGGSGAGLDGGLGQLPDSSVPTPLDANDGG
jgi:hypothetical protein